MLYKGCDFRLTTPLFVIVKKSIFAILQDTSILLNNSFSALFKVGQES